ncbi:MAG: cupin domain-containing protein [Chitinophagaceae bacterium]
MKSTLLHKKLLLCGLLSAPLYIMAQKDSITSGVFHWNELPLKKEKERETRKILEGSTREFSWFEIHATTQYKGAVPRPAHAQDSIEELIIIKEGQLKCTVGDKTATLGPGSVILIPPHVSQAFENTGNGPVSYYVLMFRSRQPADLARSDLAGGALIINADTLRYTEKDNKGTRKYFERPTAMCTNYEMHTTTLLTKGPSHAAHQHADTEIILVLSGEAGMTIDGKEYTGTDGDLFIAESGKLHGVRNAADRPCTYFAFKWR